ncbi:MAG: Mu transposase C-terminal domain-containing protein [Oscillospiraceae bacterium]
MEYLTVKEYAELKGCSERYVKKIAQDGKLSAEKTINDKGRPKYLIPLSALSPELRQSYYLKVKGESTAILPAKPATVTVSTAKKRAPREFGSFNETERAQITLWSEIIKEWRIRREEYDSKATGDMVYVEEVKRLRKNELAVLNIKVSRDILYRKYRYYKAGDLEGLTECRGGHNRDYNSIPDVLEKVFNDLYLCDRELPISDCYRLMREWALENRPDLLAALPSERTFRREADKLPEAVVKFFRKGEKACRDECLPYIIRLYDDIEANDVWVADNHTFDFMTKTEDGERLHRMYITGILDAKTGALVGWNITENPCSQSTVLALRHAIMRCGVPKILYVDNGTEFLTHDIGGKGHRSRKSQADIVNPPTILDRLGIKMVNALVCNGRAKPIERMFLTLKNTISRCIATFTGGNVVERPESLKWQLKHGFIPWDMQLREQLDTLLDGYNGSPYGGCEPQFKGMSRAEAWCKSIRRRTLTRCDESTLNLLLMRNTRYQTVKENGVYITISGEKLYYNCGIDNWKYVGQEVYVRYDPADLETVKVYDRSDKYISDWTLDKSVFVDYITVNGEDIADRQRLIARQIRAIKGYGKELTGDMQIDALALAVMEAHRKIGDVNFDAPEIESMTAPELTDSRKAVGAEEIDMKLMAERAAKRLRGKIEFD